ncbi:hypothetical protein, partial [Vibrio alginolyticus]|uniref:hypothetical protein n=1 Tax=Vibrio alginolyticus TaxID=663 RepID=UPI0038CD2952
MGEIEHVNWHAPIRAGYYPTINHHNGLPFPHRQAWSFVPNRLYPTVTEVEAIESRIHAAIDSGYILDENNK